MRGPGEILVVSCYELGRQPVAAAAAIAALERAGFAPAAQDISVDKLSNEALARARLVLISVPMHTALQLGVRVAARAREASRRVAFFGLYATLNAEHLRNRHGDFVAGENPDELVELARALETGRAPGPVSPRKRDVAVPSRSSLPLLDRYAKLSWNGEERLVASVDASQGCKHLCRHCPIVPVYRGHFVAVPRETVLADMAQQIAAGAQHVSFGDPDFLNGPTHALRIARELHARWPEVSFDATIKIEHLLEHRALLEELARCGMIFVTSAIESLNDRVLEALHKGHAAADVPLALAAVREAGTELRPTLLPYTPWSALEDVPALFDFALENDLVDAIDPVQYTLRLLLPPGSLLLDDAGPWLRTFDAQAFTWRWEHEDPRVDALWRESAEAARNGAGFDELRALANRATRRETFAPAPRRHRSVPRLTEPWFC
ncbi:MAG TPA: CUAEP/CCAEP-tail radical SAM protein [Myxococcales bacterium]|nr:CUAEP/CCAEP-tail radical SAM protein [Myxococcales bacterium]